MIAPDDDRLLWDNMADELDAAGRERLTAKVRERPGLAVEHGMREQLVRDLREVLQAETPQLALEQRAELQATARDRKVSRRLVWGVAACVVLVVLPTFAYFEAARSRQARITGRAAAEQAEQAEQREDDARRLAEESALRLKQAQAQARAERAAQLASRQEEETLAAERTLGATRGAARGRAKTKAGKPASGSTGSAASEACDPNDPLCGL